MSRRGSGKTATSDHAGRQVSRNSALVADKSSFDAHSCIRGYAQDSRVQPQASALVRNVLDSPGRPLAQETRESMEQQFGKDFSSVRVHTDNSARNSTEVLGATAYTVRNHIAFAPGTYAPETTSGRNLLAHELTHVVQHGSAGHGAPDRGFTISSPTDASEHIADGIAEGRVNPRHASTLPLGVTATNGAQLIHRKTPKGAPASTPAAPQYGPDEAWLFAENRIITELQTRYEELVRAATFQTKSQILDFFGPYDNDLKADSTFNTIVAIASGTAGNTPNDPSSIQRPGAGDSPTTPHGPIPATFSVTGGVAGGISAALQPLVGLILDTSKVGDVKDRLQTKVDTYLVEELTTSSQVYTDYEAQARDEMRQYFLSSWSETDRKHDAAGLSQLVNETAQHARASYGIASAVGGQVINAVKAYVDSQLKPLIPELDKLETAHRRKRVGAYALGAGLVGGLLGGALGFGLGGGSGLWKGALGGALIGGGLGAAGAAIANWVTPSAADVRKKKENDAAGENKKPVRNDILDDRYRPGRSTGTA
jgi:hypothetical protein